MERQIPWKFTDVSIIAPLEPISEKLSDVGRTKVRVFTKFKNRNGSYIDEFVADKLIETAVNEHVPIVGFFDKQSDDFTSHVPEDLACAYGYCDTFDGWKKHLDDDGVEREYATFNVVLHTNYFAAANRIVGNPQSMELDVNSISGDWVQMDDNEEYFVYKTAKMKGFTVLGKNVEPCFQGAAFFSENESRFDRFSLLLERVQEAENKEGGKEEMDEEKITQIEEEVSAEAAHAAEEPTIDFAAEYEKIKQSYEELQTNFANSEAQLNAANEKIGALEEAQAGFDTARAEFEQTIQNLNERLDEATKKIADYEAQMKVIEDAKKAALVEDYASNLNDEDIAPIKENIDNYSYNDLERELAVAFARKTLNGKKNEAEKKADRIPVPDEEEHSLAKLMAKYKK